MSTARKVEAWVDRMANALMDAAESFAQKVDAFFESISRRFAGS